MEDDPELLSTLRVTQLGIEVLVRALATQRVTQLGTEVIIRALAIQRVSQAGIEVLVRPDTGGPARTDHFHFIG